MRTLATVLLLGASVGISTPAAAEQLRLSQTELDGVTAGSYLSDVASAIFARLLITTPPQGGNPPSDPGTSNPPSNENDIIDADGPNVVLTTIENRRGLRESDLSVITNVNRDDSGAVSSISIRFRNDSGNPIDFRIGPTTVNSETN